MLRLLFLVVAAAAMQCPFGVWPPRTDVHSVFSDIHDGDMKCLTVKNGTDTLTITPYKTPKDTWVVEFVFNFTSCQGLVDFRVPGKPNPPQASPVEKDASGTIFASWRRSSASWLDRRTRWSRCSTSWATRIARGGCSVPGGCTLLPAPCRPLLARRPAAS